jgi:calcium/proton exchanger cax
MISLSRGTYFGDDLWGVWAATRKGVANPTTTTAIAAACFLILPISKFPNAIRSREKLINNTMIECAVATQFGAEHAEADEAPWPLGLALATLAGVTVLVALVSEVFVESVQQASVAFGMTPAFVGFIVVALVGGAAEMASAFSGARKNRLDLSVGIALGSASQIALFVAPVLVLLSYVFGPAPMNLQFWPGAW